jgi:uncharacterized protein YbjT (DUF2867 family)
LLLVIGGTGFLGGKVVERLLQKEYPIRLLTRGAGDWKTSNLGQYRKRGIKVVVGPLEDDEVLARAVEDVTCILNISGGFRLVADRRDSPYEYLNVTLVEKLLHLAKELDIQRFIQVSCLGAREESDSLFLSTKAEGDELIKNSNLYWTIFKPSYMFGERFPFIEMLQPIITFKPFLGVVGSGLNRLQPVHVDDVAKAVCESIYMRDTVKKSFDIVGPSEYSFVELLEMTRDEFGVGGSVMTIPSQLSGKVFDMLKSAMPKNTLNLELAQLLIADSFSESTEAHDFFGLSENHLEDYLGAIVEGMIEKKEKKR